MRSQPTTAPPPGTPQRIANSRRYTDQHAIRQAIDLQDIAHSSAMDAETPPHIRAALVRAWCDVVERVRIIRMKPAPRPIDTTQAVKTRKRKSATLATSPDGQETA